MLNTPVIAGIRRFFCTVTSYVLIQAVICMSRFYLKITAFREGKLRMVRSHSHFAKCMLHPIGPVALLIDLRLPEL